MSQNHLEHHSLNLIQFPWLNHFPQQFLAKHYLLQTPVFLWHFPLLFLFLLTGTIQADRHHCHRYGAHNCRNDALRPPSLSQLRAWKSRRCLQCLKFECCNFRLHLSCLPLGFKLWCICHSICIRGGICALPNASFAVRRKLLRLHSCLIYYR